MRVLSTLSAVGGSGAARAGGAAPASPAEADHAEPGDEHERERVQREHEDAGEDSLRLLERDGGHDDLDEEDRDRLGREGPVQRLRVDQHEEDGDVPKAALPFGLFTAFWAR